MGVEWSGLGVDPLSAAAARGWSCPCLLLLCLAWRGWRMPLAPSSQPRLAAKPRASTQPSGERSPLILTSYSGPGPHVPCSNAPARFFDLTMLYTVVDRQTPDQTPLRASHEILIETRPRCHRLIDAPRSGKHQAPNPDFDAAAALIQPCWPSASGRVARQPSTRA